MAKRKEKKENAVINDLDDLKEFFSSTYGKDAVRFPGDDSIVNVEVVPTGVVPIDSALGVGGIPRGRIIEIYGPESGGKTTTCLTIAAAFQHHMFGDRPGRVAFIDAEHALDPEWARKIGCDVNEFLFCQPNHGEQAYDIIEKVAASKKFELIILDSIAALSPKDEIEGTLEEDNAIGAQARMNSKAMRRLKGVLASSNCTLICVNQIREKIGVMFGSNETTPGGRALKFYASIRIDVRRSGKFEIGNATVGFQTKAKIVKNKVAPPFKEAIYNITFGIEDYPISGVDPYSGLIETALARKVIKRNGSWLSYNEENIGLGLGQAAILLASTPALFQRIYKHTMTGTDPCKADQQIQDTSPQNMDQETSSILEEVPTVDS